jgi:hypothetical protein
VSQENFLAEAADACERGRVGRVGRGRPSPFETDRSLCVRQADGEDDYRRLQGFMRLNLAGAGVLLLLAAGSAAAGHFGAGWGWPIAPWVGYVVGGLLLLPAFGLLNRASEYDRWIRRHRPELIERAESISELPIIRVSIEDPQTFDKFKITPDDCGFMALLPSAKMVLIEGVRFHQTIRAEDLVEAYDQEAATVKSIALAYRVGPSGRDQGVAGITLSAMKQEQQLRDGLRACLVVSPEGGALDGGG